MRVNPVPYFKQTHTFLNNQLDALCRVFIYFMSIHVSSVTALIIRRLNCINTRVVPKVKSNHFFHANWEQQTKESKVVDETSYCVILECLVTSIACIT